jgi:DNA-binding MarR family transcriptional regulator
MPLLAASLALLLSLSAAAEYSAHFSPESAFALSAGNTTFEGHFGNYTLFVNVSPLPSYVLVSGEGASQAALSSEIAWLVENRALQTGCNSTALYALSYKSYYCAPAGEWKDCDQAAECRKAPVPPDQPNYAPEAAAQKMAAQSAQDALGGKAGAGAAEGNQENAGARATQGITFEQALQLVGAFVLVVVSSYLILQQRQPQAQLDPQEERLLENQTRAGILEELSVADKIPTDLSLRLGKSKATVVEHLEALLCAGFVEKLATPGKKFVYYRLTRKGKQALLRRAG